MKPRENLSDILHRYASNVYFQPPEGTKLRFPCIVYKLDGIETRHADNAPYSIDSKYSITYITRDPDDPIRFELVKLPMCRFDRFMASDNLNHYTYTLYY